MLVEIKQLVMLQRAHRCNIAASASAGQILLFHFGCSFFLHIASM
jgi:hypothetical protein